MSVGQMRRNFLRVQDFEEMQNPKRPNRPTWFKSFVRDLDDPNYLELSLSSRGFLADFAKLAASMMNRVPDDKKFIARKLSIPPAVAGKALNSCLEHGFISRFAEDMKTCRNNDFYQKTDTRPIPSSNSDSQSKSLSVEVHTPVNGQGSGSNGIDALLQAVDDLEIPF